MRALIFALVAFALVTFALVTFAIAAFAALKPPSRPQPLLFQLTSRVRVRIALGSSVQSAYPNAAMSASPATVTPCHSNF